MLSESDLRGIYVPVITPFLSNEEIDLDSFRNYIGALLAHEIQGLVINGTTGESPTVSWDEVEELVQITKTSMMVHKKKLPLIIGTGTNSTASTIRRTELAGKTGADAVLVVIPYYSRPSQAGIVEHFRRIAQVGVPIILYEIPSRTGIQLTVDTIRRIMDLNEVIGLKDSSGGIRLISELTRLDTKPILCGEDILFHAMLSQGASGGILASANINTSAFIEVFRLACQGDFYKAKKIFDTLQPLIQKLFQESNPSPLKWLLAQQGVISFNTLRSPMGSISPELQAGLKAEYDKIQNLVKQ
ncbi:MAG: dihydrodipicolinate synthase [Paenibacillaceae bacterium]|jgi:4-hydroxy-tetrahydrodipicolinate synthase|nr:dihydrodipicolinate synthase [Paenibacillaceae bacterium]